MKNEKVDINEIVKYLFSDKSNKILIEQLIDAGITFSIYGSTLRAGVEIATRGNTATTPRDLDVFIEVLSLDRVASRIADIEREFKLGGYVLSFVTGYPSYIKDEKGSSGKFETYEYTVNGKPIHLVFGTTLPTNVEALDADVNCLHLRKATCTPGWTLRSSAGYDLDNVVENIKNKTFISGKNGFADRIKKLTEIGYTESETKSKRIELPAEVLKEILEVAACNQQRFTPILCSYGEISDRQLLKFKEEYKKLAANYPQIAIQERSAKFLKEMNDQINWSNITLPGKLLSELWDYPYNIGEAFFAFAKTPAAKTEFYCQLREILPKLKTWQIGSIVDKLHGCYFNDKEFLTIILPELSRDQVRTLVGRPGFNINTIFNRDILNNRKVVDKFLSVDFKLTDAQTKWMLNLIYDRYTSELAVRITGLENLSLATLLSFIKENPNIVAGQSDTMSRIYSYNKEAIELKRKVKNIFASNRLYFRDNRLYSDVTAWGHQSVEVFENGKYINIPYHEIYEKIDGIDEGNDHSLRGPAKIVTDADGNPEAEFWLAGVKVSEEDYIDMMTNAPKYRMAGREGTATTCAANGSLHNLSGPAAIGSSGEEEYWIAGRKISYETFRTLTAGSPINFAIPKELIVEPGAVYDAKLNETDTEPKEKDEMDDSVTINLGDYTDNNNNTCYAAKHSIDGSIIYTEVRYYKNKDDKTIAILRRGSKSSLGIASRYTTYKETDHIKSFTETEIVLYEVDKPIPMIEHFSPSAKVLDIIDICDEKAYLHWRNSSYDDALCAPTCSPQSNNNLHDSLIRRGYKSITVLDIIENNFAAKKTEEPKMSEETKAAEATETTETKTERPDFFTLAKRDLNEAQYRMIRSQLLDAAKSVFLAILAKDETNSPHLESVKKVLESKGGEAFLSGALGYGLTFAPGDFMQDARIQTMAEEFRVNGMHKAEEQVFDIVMGAITPTIMQTLNNSLASLPVLEEASSPPAVAKKDIQKEAEIEAQAEAEMEAEEEAALSGQRSSIAP